MAASEWEHNELHLLLRHMMVFNILLALLAVGRDFVHEFGCRGDLIVSCCTDLQTATQVRGVQEGKDSAQSDALLLNTAQLGYPCALEGR